MKHYNLSEQQSIAFRFLKDFYSPHRNRATGKSYVMACVIIQTAIENPGLNINIIDHYDIVSNVPQKKHNFNYMIDLIKSILSEMPDEISTGFDFNFAKKSVLFVPKMVSRTVLNDITNLPYK